MATTLVSLSEAWVRQGERGARFVQAMRGFLAPLSLHTQRSYVFAILELYDWIAERRGGRLPTPDLIDSHAAADYAAHLRSRDVSIVELRLRSDPARRVDYAIYQAVKRSPGATIDIVLGSLGRAEREAVEHEPGGLDRKLASLVEKKVLRRKPTLAELRVKDPTLMSRLDQRVDPSVFHYYVPTLSRGVDRAGTVRTRLAALSAFWAYCIEHSGENTGEAALLAHNHWLSQVERVNQIASDKAAVTRQQKTPTLSTFERMLATTRDQHGQPSDRLEDVRDRALLLLLYYAAPRSAEVTALRRADVSKDEPRMITIVGKRNKVRRFKLHPLIVQALDDLDRKMEALAYDADGGVKNPRMVALLSDEAPLIPAVSRWGDASTSERAEREDGITRQAIAMMLRRRAQAAGIQPGTAEWATIHPHGLRARSITKALDTGTPIHHVRLVAGHTSPATTMRYAEVVPHEDLMMHAGVAPRPAAARQEPVEAPPERPWADATVAAYEPEEEPYEPEEAEEDEPPPPSSERIVGVGTVEPLPRPLPSQRIIEEAYAEAEAEADVAAGATAALALRAPATAMSPAEQAYDLARWGEGFARGTRKALRGHDRRLDDRDLLHKVYVGTESRLPWFIGEKNSLKPELPVFSPLQLCYEDSLLRPLLATLWDRWLTQPDRGPTAARALAEWLHYALRVGKQVDDYLNALDGDCTGANWIPFDGEPETPCDVREHRDAMIARWFEARAWTFGVTRGEKVGERMTSVPIDAPEVPAWYTEPDPVAALPEGEREDLFDWLDALSSRRPGGTALRFAYANDSKKATALTRGDLWDFVERIVTYDQTKDRLDEAVRQGRMGEAENQRQLLRFVETAAQQALALLTLPPEAREAAERKDAPRTGPDLDHWRVAAMMTNRELASLLGLTEPALRKLYAAEALPEDVAKKVDAEQSTRKLVWYAADVVSLRKWRDDRVAGQKKSAGRQRRGDAYLALLGDLFGEAAAKDYVLRLAASRGDKNTIVRGDASYADLFRVDRDAGTLKHTSDFKRGFAKTTGAHSECVARRIARHLWELRQAGKRRLTDERPDEMNDQINTWAYYLWPCGEAAEKELKGYLGGQDSFDATVRRECEGGETGYTANYAKSPMATAYVANAARTVPTPVHLLAWSAAAE